MPLPRATLDALIHLIQEEGSAVFASPSDAEYFRKNYKSKPSAEIRTTAAPKAPETPPPLLKPKAEDIPLPPIPAKPKPGETSPSLAPAKPKAVEPKKEFPQPPKPSPVSFASLRTLVSVIAPELRILDEIPNDAIAKKLSERWKAKNQTAPLSILSYQEPPEQRALLEEIAQALDVYFGPAKIVSVEAIEKEKQWDAFLSTEGLKMIVVCDYTLWQLPHLLQFYKETPAQGTRLLGKIPLFLLPDLSLYLKDALLKRSLWKAFCQRCM